MFYAAFVSMYFEPVAITKTGLKLPQCSLHSIKSKETREVKTFSRKTSRDVGMVPSVSEEHVPACKIHMVEKLQEQGGVATIMDSYTDIFSVDVGQRIIQSNQPFHSMLNNPG